MGVFLIDSWDLYKQDKGNKFLRQAVFVSRENVPFELFHQTSCRLIEGFCSTSVNSSHTLSGIVNRLEKFSQTTCHHFRATCSTWKVFTDKRHHRFHWKFICLWPVLKMKENDWQLLQFFLLWLLSPFMVALSFYGIFRIWENICKNTCHKFFANISFALLQSSCLNFYARFRWFCLTLFTKMPSLNRYEKVTCENSGTQTTKLNLARHKKSCILVHCIVPNVLISQQNPEMIWVSILIWEAQRPKT